MSMQSCSQSAPTQRSTTQAYHNDVPNVEQARCNTSQQSNMQEYQPDWWKRTNAFGISEIRINLKVVTHQKVLFRKALLKVTFERNLARVSRKLSQFFFFRNKSSRLEHVLFLQVSRARYFRMRLSKENFLVCHYLNGIFQSQWWQ